MRLPCILFGFINVQYTNLFTVALTESLQSITVAARSKAGTVFAPMNTEVVGSNPIQGMGVYVLLFCVCVLCLRNAALQRADPPSKESYQLCID
jgi:hypothetical protein